MATCPLVTLGKEEQSLRKKRRQAGAQGDDGMMMAGMMIGSAGAQSDLDNEEVCVRIPCTVNGQIAQGAVDRYRFEARKGQRMVMAVQARDLIPYIADAVPGWFQPVLVLCDEKGNELAYNDDYRFKPDPVILYEIPANGIYRLALYDAIYRGREDFVYRVTIGELPFVTSIFPLGGRVNEDTTLEIKGWNLAQSTMTPDLKGKNPGIHLIAAQGQNGLNSNRKPFALSTLPECLAGDQDGTVKTAQKVTLPIIVNGRIGKPGKGAVFQFVGRAGEDIVAEVTARRLDSPLDSTLKLTDAVGKVLAINDDSEDAEAGTSTHSADSYLRTSLPADGLYYVILNDTQHRGGEDYGYRLRISEPQPDFALRVVPSSVTIQSNSMATLSVYAFRHDGFTNTITFAVKDSSHAFSVSGSMTGTQGMARISLKTNLGVTKEPIPLIIEGTAMNGTQKLVHEAVPAEDRMQAFLWRHLVPAEELKVSVINPPPRASRKK